LFGLAVAMAGCGGPQDGSQTMAQDDNADKKGYQLKNQTPYGKYYCASTPIPFNDLPQGACRPVDLLCYPASLGSLPGGELPPPSSCFVQCDPDTKISFGNYKASAYIAGTAADEDNGLDRCTSQPVALSCGQTITSNCFSSDTAEATFRTDRAKHVKVTLVTSLADENGSFIHVSTNNDRVAVTNALSSTYRTTNVQFDAMPNEPYEVFGGLPSGTPKSWENLAPGEGVECSPKASFNYVVECTDP
jgi:hypothetical protein